MIQKTELLMKRKRDGAPERAETIRYASAAACLAVVLLAAIMVPKWDRAPFSSAPFNAALANASSEQEAATAEIAPSADAQEAAPAAPSSGQQAADRDSVIRVNQLGDMIGQPPKGSGPMINRSEKWTFQQFCGLLGFDPLPTAVPEGLRLVENGTKDISFHDDRRVDFYNTWSFIYTGGSEENAKSVTVHVNPSSIPYWSVPRAYQLQGEVQLTDVDALLKLGEKSWIGGTEVTIWHKDRGSVWDYLGGGLGKPREVTDYYCADFEYRGTGFTVAAQNGITQDEFVQVLESIIK